MLGQVPKLAHNPAHRVQDTTLFSLITTFYLLVDKMIKAVAMIVFSDSVPWCLQFCHFNDSSQNYFQRYGFM